MQISSATSSEIQLTLETMIEAINAIAADALDARRLLAEAGFTRADQASDTAIERVESRLGALRPFLEELPDLEPAAAWARVNEELTEVAIAPSIVDHGGVGPHIHWTPATAKFDDQVLADMLMALAQELCDNGTSRFGRCAADNCTDLFFDGTRNRSRRFCADPRCASRTHTAEHRKRQRADN